MVKTSRNTLCRSASPAECAGCFPQYSPGMIFQREMFLKDHLLLADAFVSPSHFLIDRYGAWGLPRERFTMIENGLAPQSIAPARKIARRGAACPLWLLRPVVGIQGAACSAGSRCIHRRRGLGQ